MLYITDVGKSIRFEGDSLSRNYFDGGVLTIPKNTTLAILESNSNSVVFKSSANYDTWATGVIGQLYIQGELVNRENVIEKFNSVSNSLVGGGGDMECCEEILEKLDNISVTVSEEDLHEIAEMVSETINDKLSSLECAIGNVSCALDTIMVKK